MPVESPQNSVHRYLKINDVIRVTWVIRVTLRISYASSMIMS